MTEIRRNSVFAHSGPGQPGPEWHILEDHLRSVAEGARQASSVWGGGDLARLAGLWHDLGKYAPDWQDFLRQVGTDASASESDSNASGRRRRGPDHSSAGAIHARRVLGNNSRAAQLIAFAIAGHHAGLADRQPLDQRLAKPELHDRFIEVSRQAPEFILNTSPCEPSFPEWFMTAASIAQDAKSKSDYDTLKRSFEFLTRMTFSSLTDADFLDTEAFMERGKPSGRIEARQGWPALQGYEETLTRYLDRLAALSPTPVVTQRRRVLEWCRNASGLPRGTFSLTVPTGGGKTLSALAFALRHALKHGQKRVVIALPFLSILDQTADVFRNVFSELGGRVLVEHHSTIRPDVDTDANRRASENWDAPLIVTTQVQFFESMFSNRPGDCRKLHNLANSVIVLDEVQSLPSVLLDPILEALQELCSHYRSTLLLTTATLPALHRRALAGFPEPKPWLHPAPDEIVPAAEIQRLFDALKRVEVQWPDKQETAWTELAAKIALEAQALAIVHRREDARDLWKEVEALVPGTIHLSALMCPAHRRDVLSEIRRRLAAGDVCRVVSTQLVEAGVDVDFPVVFRAMAGLESLAQSAGRCNREGKLRQLGKFVIYNAPTPPPGLLKHHLDIAQEMLAADPALSLTSPETFRKYFDRLYLNTDRDGIQAMRAAWKFTETAKTFRMIDDATITLFVPWGSDGRSAIKAFRFAGPSRDRFRELQQFGVAVYPATFRDLQSFGLVEQLHDSAWCLISERSYHPTFGLDLKPAEFQSIVV